MKVHRLNDVRNDLSLDEGFRRRQQKMPIAGTKAALPPGCGWRNFDVAIFRRAVALPDFRLGWAPAAEAK